MPPPPRLLGLRILIWRMRAPLLAAAAVLAALAVARTAAPPPPVTEAVVVLARDVPAGSTLTRADLRLGRLPAGAVPESAETDPAALVGRSLAVPGEARLPVVGSLLAGARFEVEPPPGSVVVPVRLAGSGVALLRPGDRVDLVATADPWASVPGPEAAEGTGSPGAGGAPARAASAEAGVALAPAPAVVLARRALVVEVPVPGPSGALGLGGPPGEPSVLVAVTADEGRALAAGSAGSALGAVLVD